MSDINESGFILETHLFHLPSASGAIVTYMSNGLLRTQVTTDYCLYSAKEGKITYRDRLERFAKCGPGEPSPQEVAAPMLSCAKDRLDEEHWLATNDPRQLCSEPRLEKLFSEAPVFGKSMLSDEEMEYLTSLAMLRPLLLDELQTFGDQGDALSLHQLLEQLKRVPHALGKEKIEA